MRTSGARLAVLVLALPFACESAQKPECAALCGPGTICVEGQCVVEAPVAGPAPEASKKTRKKKRRKTKRARRPGAAGEAAAEADDASSGEPAPADDLPPFVAVDDRKIPQFKAQATQTIDLKAGSERPNERVLDQHFGQITPKITRCVVTASRYGEVGSGRLAVKLRLLPSGKVESVTVNAPASLSVWGIVPCARKAVFDHRFPGYDGPSVAVDFAVDVD